MDVDIEFAPLDDSCKEILRKMVASGFNKAGVLYIAEPPDFSQEEFALLLRTGHMKWDTPGGRVSGAVLSSYETRSSGPYAGKIAFRLSVNLTSQKTPATPIAPVRH